MNPVLQSALRQFVREDHIRDVLEGEWISLVGEDGRPLPGIRGRVGASLLTAQGFEFGADAIEMQPGSAFPLHVHDGDHVLYVIRGSGAVHVNGVDHRVRAGDTITIPAELPHGVHVRGDTDTRPVATDPTGSEPLLILAVGHPHKGLDSPDRMRIVEGDTDESAPDRAR